MVSSPSLEFGAILPRFGPLATRTNFSAVGTTAEEHGYDFVWTGDHIAFADAVTDEYPFSTDGVSPFSIETPAHDVFQVLSYLAAEVDDIRLGTNTCIVPYRHPVHLAKSILTIESLSNGLFDFGVAPGWDRAEFEVLDVAFEDRGSLTDEFLALFDRVCTEAEFSFDGPHHSFERVGFYPRPVQSGGPPVFVGGHSGASFRRVAEFGDGWTAFYATPDDIAAASERIGNAWDDYDRDGDPAIAVTQPVDIASDGSVDTDGTLCGTPSEVAAAVDAYREAGVTHLVLELTGSTIDDRLTQLQRFADDIIPAVS